MNKIKFFIITIITIILVLVTIILVTNTKKNTAGNEVKLNEKNQEIIEEVSTNSKEVTNTAMYFTVKSCIDIYTKYISDRNAQAIISVLSKDYIKENNITTDNIFEKINVVDGKNIDFDINKMIVENDGEDIQTYYIKGVMRNENNNKVEKKLTLNIDIENKVFTIIPEVTKEVFN